MRATPAILACPAALSLTDFSHLPAGRGAGPAANPPAQIKSAAGFAAPRCRIPGYP